MLGPIEFRRDEEAIQLRAAKAVALLAYLALSDAPQRREMLADLLWPHSLPQASLKNLSNTLWRLRKKVGDVVVKSDGNCLMLGDGVWSDSQQFESTVESLLGEETPAIEALEAAIQLYRGSLLDGLTLWNAPDFELWLRTEQTRFSELYLSALEMLVTAHRARGNWQAIIPLARQAMTYDPLRESMVQALMEAQAQLGERRAALRDYDALRSALQSELKVNPLPETEALYQAILRGAIPIPDHGDNGEEPALKSSAVISKLPPQPLRPSPHRLDKPFVGRQIERNALDEEMQRAAEGQARVVLLTGELGIGKSRLWQMWSARLRTSLSTSLPTSPLILQTRCLDTAQALPFAPVTRLFRQPDFFERLFKAPSPLSPIWLAELAHLLPEIKQEWQNIGAIPRGCPPDEQRLRLFEAFTQALQALEGRPLILFVDDLHWADQATLDCLLYLVDRMRHEALLLVAAYRPSDASARLVQQIANWHREAVVRHLPIEPLTLEEATELLNAQSDSYGSIDNTLTTQLHAKSGGNPYFLLELYRAPKGSTPPALAQLVRARLAELPKTTHKILQAAVVLETEIGFDLLCRTSGRSEEEALNGLELLVERDFLVERAGGDCYEFVHPLVSRVVHDDLSVPRRRVLHHRAANALQALHTRDEATIVGRLATHYREANRPTEAAKYAELAAERAMALAAPSEAAAYYRQAIALEPTPARLMGLGQALIDHGESHSARQAWQDAATAFEAIADKVGVARAYGTIAGSYMVSGEGKEVVQWAERALRAGEKESDPTVIAQAHIFLTSGSLLLERSFATAEHHLTQAVYIATDNDLPEIAAQGQLMLGNLLAEKGELGEALQAYKAGISLVQASGNHYIEVFGHNNVAYHAMLTDDLLTAHKHIEMGLALIEQHLLASPPQFLYCTRGEIALAEGALDEAESWLNRALTEAESSGNQLQAANIHAKLGLVARERGHLNAALTFLTDAHHAVTTGSATHLQTQIDLWLAELHLQRGEPTAAEEALRRAEERLSGSERQGLQAWARQVRASLGGGALRITSPFGFFKEPRGNEGK
ncbi:MAG: BTAD domain-containing putative transcriptional regulator [Ardenticatenaceae bacterium]